MNIKEIQDRQGIELVDGVTARYRNRIVQVRTIDGTGNVVSYSELGNPGSRYYPLIEGGRNVERFEIIMKEDCKTK